VTPRQRIPNLDEALPVFADQFRKLLLGGEYAVSCFPRALRDAWTVMSLSALMLNAFM